MKEIYLTLLLLFAPTTCLASDVQSWFFSVVRFTPDPVQVELLIHERQVDGFNDFGLFQIQPRFSTPCGEYLRCGLNYSYLVQELTRDQSGEVNVLHQNRFEAEINPSFFLDEGIRYNGRNRFEYLTDSSINHVSSRFRHRSLVEFPGAVSESLGLVTGTELFWDFEAGRFNQHRIVPAGLRYRYSSSQQLSFLPMLMLNRSDEGWVSDLVLWFEVFSDFTLRD